MKSEIAASTVRAALRHPRAASAITLVALRRHRETTKIIRLANRTMNSVDDVANPKVRKELRAATASLADAVSRSKKIGWTATPSDKRFAKKLDATGTHLSKALDYARGRKRRNWVRPGFVAITVTSAGAYGVWKLGDRPKRADGSSPAM